MTTPICDFVKAYAASETLRMHMPGHKGCLLTGFEPFDITEIAGADSLYEADGIIAESERNASSLFGADTFYSTEGSSLCIRAMLYLTRLHAKNRAKILAGRNAHKAFLSAAALLDFDVEWLFSQESYLSCKMDGQTLEEMLEAEPIAAVYLTTPDYLGNLEELSELAAVCHRHGVWLLVDNAHGAYLRFLTPSRHPIDLGADLCCDSAHKTLPALTGAAYLHLSRALPESFRLHAKSAMALFGSTSPSYLILQSLDAVNAYVADDYRTKLHETICQVEKLRTCLIEAGFRLVGNEPLKLTIATKEYGYTGDELAAYLREAEIECEFSDPDYLVLMLTPENAHGIQRVQRALLSLPKKRARGDLPPNFSHPERVLRIREAMLAPSEEIFAVDAEGRILATTAVGCPPAVSIVVSGERITAEAVRCFAYYHIDKCFVVKREAH